MKPRLFVGSSSESLSVAHAVQEALERDLEVTVWDQGIFRPSATALDSVIEALDSSDYGVFVFAPDDRSIIRGEEKGVARDNVVFELGLFLGRLGRGRGFVLLPRGEPLHLPSDILGFMPAEYDAHRQDGNLQAAVGSACNRIRDAVQHSEAGALSRWTTEWRLGRKATLYQEQLTLREGVRGRVNGSRLTKSASGREVTYVVSGFHRGGFYWLEYHTEDCTGGGTILLRDLTGQKLHGVVASIQCDTGALRAVANQWVQEGADAQYSSEWQDLLGESRADSA